MPSLYSFSHLTIHEYLVARYIIDNRQEIKLLNTYRSNKKWEEIIRLVAKMLPNADEYMTNLQSVKMFNNPNQVVLLKAAWLSKPICSAQLRKKLMAQIALKIDGMTKRYSQFKLIKSNLGWTLVIPVHVPSSLNNDPKKKKYLFPSFVDCIPNLLRILKASGFSYGELGVKNSLIFDTLAEANVNEIYDVRFTNVEDDRPIEFPKTG